jgi:ATP-dependent DNA ligase
MLFIPPMLCSRMEDPARLTDPRCVAEPKLDGQRAQVHLRVLTIIKKREISDRPATEWVAERV